MNQRKIKFRAWDKEKKEWITNFQVSHDGLIRWLKPDPKNFDKLEWQSVVGHDIELMQYTGLKDKNDKEIYEGDILAGREVHRDNFYCVVDFSSGAFRGYTIPGRNHYRPLSNMMTDEGAEYNEIIGNIWENPKLLK